MSKLLLDGKAVALLGDFCDVDTLQNRIELIDDVKDRLLMELGDSESEEEMNKDFKMFLDWLKENDRSEEEKMQCKLLDEYMKTRDNLPGKGVTGTELVFDPKSSEEIAEDLQPMYYMDIHIIANYMFMHEFGTTTVEDGTVKWAIWRDMDFMV